MTNARFFTEQWMNDYLDLYNYAVQSGDEQWQEDILLKLKSSGSMIEEELRSIRRNALWQSFDLINRRMLELYNQIKSSEHLNDVHHLQEAVWELKMLRVAISSKINGNER
ncbi:hypothetical protein ACFO9Q_17215 [Paenibacillus sp. GCM10023252]|uniref:hypothetical protein n=1 Tax=Paenibacillus sp. GCM10023252 TaxID=3252649 RepID=UPI00361CCD7E